MKGWICEENDTCAGRWNVSERHVIKSKLVYCNRGDGDGDGDVLMMVVIAMGMR